MSRHVPKKNEQHQLGSQHLHEVEAWEPPRHRSRKPPVQLPGQIDLLDVVEDDEDPS